MNQKPTNAKKSAKGSPAKDERLEEINAIKDGLPVVQDYWTFVANELEQLKRA